MKRASSPISATTKRSRHSVPDSDIFSLQDAAEQDLTDMSHHGVDQTKCINGSFQSVRTRSEHKIEAMACITDTLGEKHVMKLCFELNNTHFSIFDPRPLDQFRLSLRGAKVRNASAIPPNCTVPFFLVFAEGLHISWTHQGADSEPKYLNTWLASTPNQTGVDSWYCSQEERHDLSQTPNLTESQEVLETSPNSGAESDLKSARASKRKQKAEAKRQKREALQQANCGTDVSSRPPPSDNTNQLQSDNFASSQSPPQSLIRKPNEHSKFKTGFRSDPNIYTAIGDAPKRFTQYLHLTGIVTDVSEPKPTRKGDWSCHVQIMDPSNYSFESFKVTCFTGRHKEWLPHPKHGELLLLRDIKVTEFNGTICGVGHKNKLRWAAYSPSKREFHHGELNQAPKKEGLGPGGSGVPFSPFFDPGPLELEYCSGLFDWWQGVTQKAENDSAMSVQMAEKSYRSTQRIHRLISEAGPNVPPSGYFDCTVEILRVYTTSESVRTLYATDYTRQEGMMGSQNNSWPPSLSEYVLGFEMWDGAAQIAKDMRPGEYYLINNARMRFTPHGQIEAKVVQNKIVRLKEDDLASNVYLKALLERKEAWASKESKSEQEVPYELVKDVKEGNFFNCTVELLHASCEPHQTPHIYVTDYTAHPRLPTLNRPWSAGLEGRIVKIALSDEQIHIAKSPNIGSYYAIRKLRLRHSATDNCFRGFLGGHEKLVVALNSKRIDNEHLNGLLRRREQWTHTQQPYCTDERPRVVQTSRMNGPFTRIQDVPLSNWDIGLYQLVARVVDFHPLQLCDAFYQRCSLCDGVIPDSRRACFKCEDFEREHIQIVYQMYILIQDEEGEQIKVSINDKCPLLAGLHRAHLRDDQVAFREFYARISPILGNLEEMHEELTSGKTVRYSANGPLFCLDLETWVVAPEATRAFSLNNYERIP